MARFHLAPIAAALSAALASGGTLAQQAQDPQLPEVKVKAAPTLPGEPSPPYAGGQVARGARAGMLGDVDFMNLPWSATGYTSQTMRDQQARTIGDVVQNDASIRTYRGFGTYHDQFLIRGFAVSNDDVAYGGLYGILPRQSISTELLERVEVFRGPSALINGMPPGGSVGGSINVVPKRAGDTPLARFTLNTQSGGYGGLSADVGRRFGADGIVGVRFNGVSREGETAVSGARREMSLGALGLDVRTERVRVSLDLGRQKQDFHADPMYVRLAANLAVPNAPDASRSYEQAWQSYRLDDDFTALRGEFDITTDISAWVAHGTRQSFEVSVSGSPTVNNAAGASTATRTRIVSYWDRATSEAGVRAAFATGPVRHKLSAFATLVGVENGNTFNTEGAAFASNLYNRINVTAPVFAGLSEFAPKLGEQRFSSFGLADTLSFADERVQFTLGVRRQQVRVEAFNAAGVQTSVYDERATSPSAGLVVKPWRNVSLYANLSEGLSQGPTAPNAAANRGQIFPPFKTRQKEAGVKYDRGTLGLTLAAFELQQPNSFTNATTNIFGLDGEQRNRGIEASAFGRIGKQWRVLGGITLIDAVQTRTLGGANNGKTAVGVPESMINLGAEWDAGFLPGLTFSGRMLHTGPQTLDANNARWIGKWTRWDAGVRYATKVAGKPIALRANVENLFDRDYWSSTTGGYLSLAAPRTVYLSASVDF